MLSLVSGVLLVAFSLAAQPTTEEDIPGQAVQDGIMASPLEMRQMLDWTSLAFTEGQAAGTGRQPEPETRPQAHQGEQGNLLLNRGGPPFSFVYGGTGSKELLQTWRRAVETKEYPDRVERRIRWQDAKTGLVVSAVVQSFKNYPAADWVLYFENEGTRDTPILENVQAADLALDTGNATTPAWLHQLRGDSCDAESFTPLTTALPAKTSLRLAPAGGRPSAVSAFPFFDLEYGGQGIVAAVGWSGQWAASFERTEQGPTRFQAGMEHVHLLLHPGEKIRTPRVLLMAWRGDRPAGLNRFRRLMLFHYVPQRQGKPVLLPVVMQCFDRYSGSRKDWATEAGQLSAIRSAQALGINAHWLDAAWFPGGFPNGVGNWFANTNAFPNGLGPLGEQCHRLGMKFVVWFEPERVAPGTALAREHPEFVMGGEKGGLFKLNDPAARRYLTDLLSRRITEYGIDIYRNDFNIDPLGFWRQNDAPDRQGLTEIRYVEGHYAMWDELRARHPGLIIDNCASGGRRIDLETCMRSVPLWRSDTGCSPGHPDWNQVQTAGLSQYIPFHSACVWTPDPYDARSAGTAGLVCQFDYLDPLFPKDLARASIAEAEENQKFWYGDFYMLANASVAPDQFVAYQFHRPDQDAGLVLGFRHSQCGYLGLIVGLSGVKPAQRYDVDFISDSREKTCKTLTGEELRGGLELRVAKAGGSLLVRYRAHRD
jgi:alpha-galactosidase